MKTTAAVRFETRGVLAGAYRGKNIETRSLLTHAVGVDETGAELFVLCRGVKLDHVVDCFEGDGSAPPTCPRCGERLAKLNAK